MKKLCLLLSFICLLILPAKSEVLSFSTNSTEIRFKFAEENKIWTVIPKKHIKSKDLTEKLKKEHPNLKFKNLEHLNLLLVEDESNTNREEKEKNLKKLKNHEDVETLVGNQKFKTREVPSDPLYTNQWGVQKIDTVRGWAITQGSPNVIVGVVDTGIDYTHEDLIDNLFIDPTDNTPGYTAENGILKNGGQDDYGHGTHVAGIIAAKANNGVGIVGVAPNVKLMSFKFLNSRGEGSFSDFALLADKIIELKQRGINILVLNNSWGGGGYNVALESVFKSLEANGISSVCAAGNSNTDLDREEDTPATLRVDSLIPVVASDINDKKAYFSSYGLRTSVAAPGVSIFSTLLRTNAELIDPSGYGYLSGTSMACPHVVGLCALILSVNPNLTPLQIKNIICNKNSTDWLDEIFTSTGARINVYKTLTNTLSSNLWANKSPKITNPVTNYTVLAGSSLQYSFNAVDGDGDDIYYFVGSSFLNKYIPTNYLSLNIPNYIKDNSYYIKSVAIDRNGGYSDWTTYVDALRNTNFIFKDFNLNVNVYKHPWSKTWYVADVCYNDNSNLYWVFDTLTWVIDGTPYINRSTVTNGICNTLAFPLYYDPEHLIEIKGLNEYGQWYKSQRFYFNGSEQVFNPTNRYPHVVINTDVDSGPYPLTVNWDISSSYDEDGTVDVYWRMEFIPGIGWAFTSEGNKNKGTRVFNEPGKYFIEFMVRDNNFATHYDYKEINVLYSSNRNITTTNPPVPPQPPQEVLNAVTNLNGFINGNLITLNWTDTSVGETKWIVEYSLSKTGNSFGPWMVATILNADSSSVNLTKPKSNKFVAYRIKPCKDTICAQYSNLVKLRIR